MFIHLLILVYTKVYTGITLSIMCYTLSNTRSIHIYTLFHLIYLSISLYNHDMIMLYLLYSSICVILLSTISIHYGIHNVILIYIVYTICMIGIDVLKLRL